MLSTAEKRAIKNYLLSVDPHCMWCGKWLHNDDGHVQPQEYPHCHVATLEHILALSEGGTDELDNLGLACFICNQSGAPGWAAKVRAKGVLHREVSHSRHILS